MQLEDFKRLTIEQTIPRLLKSSSCKNQIAKKPVTSGTRGIEYWKQIWNKGSYVEDYHNADYVLKHYARLWLGAAYSKDIATFYFGTGRGVLVPTINSTSLRSTPDRKNMGAVINDLVTILNGPPVYKDDDLYNILKVFQERTDCKDCMEHFKIQEKPSAIQTVFSFFKIGSGKPSEKKPEKEENYSPK